MKNALQIFEDWYFQPRTGFSLGAARFLFYTYTLLYFSLSGSMSPGFMKGADFVTRTEEIWVPIPILEFLGLTEIPSAGLVALLIVSWWVAIVFSALGLFTRIATVATLILSFYLIGLDWSFGHAGHRYNLVIQVMAVLALSRCGDGFSLDSLLWRKHKKPDQSSVYGWPTRLIQILYVYMFFAAGLTKVVRNHTRLFELMTYMLSWRRLHGGPTAWQFQRDLLAMFNETPFLRWLAGVGTVALELAAPLVLRRGALGLGMLLTFIFFQFVLFAVMGVRFFEYFGVYAFFVNWDWVAQKAQALGSSLAHRKAAIEC